MAIEFKKAEKKQAKLRLAITGPSGSGKTYSALQIAQGIGKRVALIDTENHSASLYAGEPGMPAFEVVEIEPPYTVQKYIEAINAAVEAGYDILVIDSISHAWAGEGGLLDKKTALDMRGGNNYTNWAQPTKEHEAFKGRLLNCDIHLITTMRSKQDYVLSQNDKGQATPKKVGMAPIQRDGMEYEFTMVLDMGMDHQASVSKTRIKAFDGRIFQPTKKTGQELLKWLMDGKVPEPAPVNPPVAATAPMPDQKSATESPIEKVIVIPVSVTPHVDAKSGKSYWGVEDLEGVTYLVGDKMTAAFCIDAVTKKAKIEIQYQQRPFKGANVPCVVMAQALETAA